MSTFDKIEQIIDLVMELWGEEIFDYLQAKAKESDTIIDDMVVDKLRAWLLK